MAISTTATTTTAAAASRGGGPLDSIPVVDLRLLSHSEIYALSLFSSSSSFACDDDVAIPKIDRSAFNESAGSRKQTFSRLRLAPPSSSPSANLRRRNLRSAAAADSSDHENGENSQMLDLFKKLFVQDFDFTETFPIRVDHDVHLSGHKRKRDEPLGLGLGFSNVYAVSSLTEIVVPSENVDEKDREMLNGDGVAVDLVALGAVDDPYREEITRRTEGLERKEELLGFMEGLEGQWGNNRKKKRIVDASEFGNALPVGWKLLLGVEKKKGRAWLGCARYISPSGRQFVSCKEASLYLLTLNGVQDTHPSTSAQHNEIADDRSTSIKIADIATRDVDIEENLLSHTLIPAFASTTSNREMQVKSDSVFLPEERQGEIINCKTCNVTFCQRDELLHYRSSVHLRNGCKNVVRVAGGVKINEKKSFQDASNYVSVNSCAAEIIADGSGSQKTHDVKNNVIENSVTIEKPEQKNVVSECSFSVKQPSNLEDFPCKIIDSADNTSTSASMGSKLNVQSDTSMLASSCDEKSTVDEKRGSEADDIPLCLRNDMQFGFGSVIPSWNETESMSVKNDSKVCTGQKSNCNVDNNDDGIFGRKMELLEFEGIKMDPLVNNHLQGHLEEERNFGIDFHDLSFNNRRNEFGQNFLVGFGDSSAQTSDCIPPDGSWRTGHENLFQGCFDDVPNPHVESPSCFRTFGLRSDEVVEGSFGLSKNADIHTETLRPGSNGPVEYSFLGSNSLLGESSKNYPDNVNTEQGFDHSFWLGKDDTGDTNHQANTSVCVWCGNLFYQEPIQQQPGTQTGAIGSLCPSCSSGIPGQFSVL